MVPADAEELTARRGFYSCLLPPVAGKLGGNRGPGPANFPFLQRRPVVPALGSGPTRRVVE